MTEATTAQSADADFLNDTLPIMDLDHPGSNDEAYRQRRVHIASLAKTFRANPDGPYPVIDYSEEENEVWRTVCAALTELQATRACSSYKRGREKLAIPTDHIPQLGEISARLQAQSGFRMWPIEGLILPRIFLSHLADGVMLSTQYIRHASRPFFTPEPDIVHEILGHAPMFVQKDFAALSRQIGRGARAADEEQLEQMSRLYWFTVEFGLIEEEGDVRAFGAGLLGGVEELRRALGGDADLRPFSLGEVIETEYDYNYPQPRYFVIPSFASLRDDIAGFVEGIAGIEKD